MHATALEEVLLDIEGAFDDRLRSGEVDLDRLRSSLGISVLQACSFHGMEEQRQAVDIDPFGIMTRWALNYGLTEVASRLRRLIAKLRTTRNEDPPKILTRPATYTRKERGCFSRFSPAPPLIVGSRGSTLLR